MVSENKQRDEKTRHNRQPVLRQVPNRQHRCRRMIPARIRLIVDGDWSCFQLHSLFCIVVFLPLTTQSRHHQHRETPHDKRTVHMHHPFGFHLIGIGKAFRQKTKQKVDEGGTQYTNEHACQQVAGIVNAQIQARITREQGPENQKQTEVPAL